MEASFYQAKRTVIHEWLPDSSVLILFSGEAPHKTKDQEYGFSVNRNFYYLTGLNRPSQIYVVSKMRGQITETLFIEKANPDVEKWIGKRLLASEATSISGLTSIQYLEDFDQHLSRLLNGGTYQTLALDIDRNSYQQTPSRATLFATEMQARYPYLALRNVYSDISQLRVVKSPEEVEEIRKAIDITNQGIRNMIAHAHAGIREYELEAHFNFPLQMAGVREHAFDTIIAGGERATVLHYVENLEVVQDNEMVLTDLGATHNLYCADISRTFPVNGKFTPTQKKFYNIVLQSQHDTIAAVKPGVTLKELNEVTKASLTRQLKEVGFLTDESLLGNYYYHSVSHYLGLDVHDVGDSSLPIPPGAVITIEPGLYIAEEKIGIRIEEDVLVTELGCEVLSEAIIKTVEDIESFMAAHQHA
jgi:Xaa-Pro aminopeptidase